MRKVERDMLKAIRSLRNWKSGNTEVRITEYRAEKRNPVIEVLLHHNLIAMILPSSGIMTLYDGGWQTVTTKSRLNALLEIAHGGRAHNGIHQKKYVWYIGDHTFESGVTVRLDTTVITTL